MPQTLFDKRRALHEKREARHAAGLCIECGDEPPALRMSDGQMGKTCAKCRRNYRYRLGNGADSKRDTETGFDFTDGYLDCQPFREYCVRVAEIVRSGAKSIGDQKRALGDAFNQRFHWDALTMLVAAREIVEERTVSPRTWRVL